jgi:hypothetical protein
MQKGDYRWSIATQMESPVTYHFVLERMRSRKTGDMICAGPSRKRRGIAMRDLNAHRALCDEIGIIAEG